MVCGWKCGAKLTSTQMRRHFTECPLRPRRLGNAVPVKPCRSGWPPGPQMPCGWRCGMKLTATGMRKHFAQCRKQLRREGNGGRLRQTEAAESLPQSSERGGVSQDGNGTPGRPADFAGA